MKKYILTTLALILTAGTFDASAQSLLKKLGQQALKEVGTRVENHVKTEAQKAVSNAKSKGKASEAPDAPKASQSNVTHVAADIYDQINKRVEIGTTETMVEYGAESAFDNHLAVSAVELQSQALSVVKKEKLSV